MSRSTQNRGPQNTRTEKTGFSIGISSAVRSLETRKGDNGEQVRVVPPCGWSGECARERTRERCEREEEPTTEYKCTSHTLEQKWVGLAAIYC